RPSMISGKPVWLATSFTAMPACARSFAVPPVERISTLRFASSRASATTPSLSETEMSARRRGTSMGQHPCKQMKNMRSRLSPGHRVIYREALNRRAAERAPCRQPSVRQGELAQLLAQRPAVDPENAGRAALVAFHVVEHRLEQRLFAFAQDHIVQLRGPVTVQAREVIVQRLFGVIA